MYRACTFIPCSLIAFTGRMYTSAARYVRYAMMYRYTKYSGMPTRDYPSYNSIVITFTLAQITSMVPPSLFVMPFVL